MPTYYHNPENALKRANEFSELGKDEEALECLFDALKNRKFRMLKQIHENIINKFLELCVELKKSQMAKDGLYCYRNLCQGVNIKSWEDSIRKYLQLAESKVENAQQAFQTLILDVEDLDQDMTPEMLLKAVTSERPQERTERIILLPWVKFLWECHRNCLDLLRNIQTEKIYHAVAQNAFKFCIKFSRRNELRKLYNILKLHSIHMQKRHAHLRIDDFEIPHMYVETAFVELESAITMELWQDAFKVLEDIHSVISDSKKLQHSKIMAHYYDKISCVFWKGEEYLFHSAAVLRYFILVKDQKKNLGSDEITKLASCVLLSVLAIRLEPVTPKIDLVAETDVTVIDKKNRLLSCLLDLSKCPTRESLIKEVIHLGIIQFVPKEFLNLFQAIENDMEPLKIRLFISEVVEYINNWTGCELEQYIPLVHKTAVVKLLSVLSKIYTSIKISTLKKFTGILNECDLEILLVDSARRYELPLRIDHRNMCVYFSDNFDVFQEQKVWNDTDAKNSFTDNHLKCLTITHSVLSKAVDLICPDRSKKESKLIAEKIARRYIREGEVYRKNLLRRKNIIEKHKEYMENMRLQKEEEEKNILAQKLSQYKAAEKERLQRETEERHLQRLRREQEEIKRKILIEKMETLKKTTLGSQIIESISNDDFDNLDPKILFSKQIQQLNKERKELASRLRRQEKSVDHFERAKRVEEIPLLIEHYNEEKKTDLEMWKEDERKKLETAHKERERDLKKKARMLEIEKDLNNFLEVFRKKQYDSYILQMQEFLKTLTEEKTKRLKARAANRKQQRKDEWNKQQELRKLKSIENACKREHRVANYIRTENKNNSGKVNVLDQSANFANSVQNILSKEGDSFPYQECHSSEAVCSGNIKNQSLSTGASVWTHNTKDTYYYNKVYKYRKQLAERTEVCDRRTKIYSESDNDSSRAYYSTSHHRIRTSIYEESIETTRSWRKPEASNVTYKAATFTNYCLNKEDDIPRRTITIMKRRDTGSEASSNVCDHYSNTNMPDIGSRKSKQSDDPKCDIHHSCTPWAKLKRQAQSK